MIVVLIVIYVMILLIYLVKPAHSTMSRFELERRAGKGDKAATGVLRREQLIPDVLVLKNFLVVVLMLVFIGVASGAYGLLMALFVAGLVVVSLGPVSKVKMLGRLVGRLYQKIEEPVLKFVDKLAWAFDLYHDISGDIVVGKVDSKEELEHIVRQAGAGIISDDEKTIILSTLKFDEKTVADIMVKREKIVSVGKDELLGPLELDNLHKTSHSHFPVVGGDLDHVEGVIRLKDIASLESKTSPKAGAVMMKRVYFVREDHSLGYALNAFVRTNFHFFVVINAERETVGVLTLRDLMQSLLGKDAVDEFDGDDDKKAVANRKPNNNPRGGIDV